MNQRRRRVTMNRQLRFEAPSRLASALTYVYDMPTSNSGVAPTPTSHRNLSFNTTSGNLTTDDANIATAREENRYQSISFEEYASVAVECLEFVSTDTHLAGDEGGDEVQRVDDVSSANIPRDPNVCSAYFQSTFAGCTNTNDIRKSLVETNGTIVKGAVMFPYDLWLKQQLGVSQEESVATLEAMILRFLAGQLDFACDDPASGGIIGLSTNPIDEVDASFGTCTSNSPFVASEEGEGGFDSTDSLKCLPMMGEMTYYVSTTEDAARTTIDAIENDIFGRVETGAAEDSFVSDDIVEVVIVDRNLIGIKGDGDGGIPWPIIGGIIGGVVALIALLALAVLLVRRKKEKQRQQAEIESQYPFDVSDWDADSVPEDFQIDRDLGVVYRKSESSPDTSGTTYVGDECDVDDSFTSWITSFGFPSDE